MHGYLTCSSDGNNYGATCEYHCNGGYERQGVASRVCQFNRNWDGDPAQCVRESSSKCNNARELAAHIDCKAVWTQDCDFVFAAMEIKSDVKTVSALLNQFFEKKRLLILSAPNISDTDYQLQNIMIQARKLLLASRGSLPKKVIEQ